MDPKRRLRVLVVTNMYPTPETPAFGSFVRDQVQALRATGAVDVDLFTFDARRTPVAVRAGGGGAAAPPPPARPRPRSLRAERHRLPRAPPPPAPRPHGARPRLPPPRRASPDRPRRAPGGSTIAVSRELAAICPFPVTAVCRRASTSSSSIPSPRRGSRRLGLDPTERFFLFPSDPRRPEKRYERARRRSRRRAGEAARV